MPAPTCRTPSPGCRLLIQSGLISAVGPAAANADSGGRNADGGPYDDLMGFGGRQGMGAFGDGMSAFDSFRYGVIWFPNVPVAGQAAEFQSVRQDLSFAHPLWTDPLNVLSLSGGVRNLFTDTAAVLPDTGQPFPENLWDVHLGLRYARQLGDGWIVGGGVSIGSASDHPFAAISEMYVSMNAMLRIPQGKHNAWILSSMYAPSSELNFPIPGVAFSYNPPVAVSRQCRSSFHGAVAADRRSAVSGVVHAHPHHSRQGDSIASRIA